MKKKYELHYAKLSSDGDIPCLKTDVFNEIHDAIKLRLNETRNECVYLFAFNCIIEEYHEVVVSENLEFIESFFASGMIGGIDMILDCNKFFIQEYESFEAAYEVALTMKETSKLCYS